MMILLTGHPGVGKTTAILKALEALKLRRNVRIGGMITREVREGRRRVGFQLVDLATGRTGWLAHVNQREGPQVGKYGVNLRDLDEIGVKALENALKSADVIVCDEIGPMELTSTEFKRAVKKLAESDKLVIGSIHYRLSKSLINELKDCRELKILMVTYNNRDFIPYLIFREITKVLSGE